MKPNSQCSSCQTLSNKLKILQADYDFEIKKLYEDKSSEKALYELNMNREIKKLQQKCHKEKDLRAKQNQSWMKKYDELVQKQTTQMLQYKAQKNAQSEQFKKNQQQEMQKFKLETVSGLEERIQSLKQQNEAMCAELTLQYESRIQSLMIQNNQKVALLARRHDEQLRRKCAQYEATIVGIQSQKTVEENLHRKTKEQSRESQARLNQEIYTLKKSIIEHEDKIGSLRAEIREKCDEVAFLHGQITRGSCENQQKISQLTSSYEEKFESHRQGTEQCLYQLFKRELQNCSKYEKALQKIDEHREMQNQMYQANLSEIKSCVEERQSRCEDVDEIVRLRQRLGKKQRECEMLSEELKLYRLELENKEETYNKIFGLEAKQNQSIYIRRKELKSKRTGKSVTTVRQALGTVNQGTNLAPLVGNIERRLLPPKQNKIL